jgi:hypothetical protein
MQLTEFGFVAQSTNLNWHGSIYAKVHGSYTVLFGKFVMGMIVKNLAVCKESSGRRDVKLHLGNKEFDQGVQGFHCC